MEWRFGAYKVIPTKFFGLVRTCPGKKNKLETRSSTHLPSLPLGKKNLSLPPGLANTCACGAELVGRPRARQAPGGQI